MGGNASSAQRLQHNVGGCLALHGAHHALSTWASSAASGAVAATKWRRAAPPAIFAREKNFHKQQISTMTFFSRKSSLFLMGRDDVYGAGDNGRRTYRDAQLQRNNISTLFCMISRLGHHRPSVINGGQL